MLEDAVDPATIAALDAEIEPFDREVLDFLHTQPEGRFSIAGVDTVSIAVHLVAALARCSRDFCASPLFADLCHDLIGPDARLYWEQAVYKQPHGAEPVLWHQDNGYTYVEPQAYLTCWVALTDATLDNGCVWVLPGRAPHAAPSRTANTPIGFQCCEDPDGAVAVPVKAGEHRRVLVAHPARDRAQHAPTRCARPTSSSTRPTARSRCKATRPRARPPRACPQDDPRRQFPVLAMASTSRCSLADLE